MKYQFKKFIDKYDQVYILKFKMMNKYIIESDIDYAACTIGIHPNGITQICKGSKNLVVSESDMLDLSEKFNLTIPELISNKKAVSYSKDQNDDRMRKKAERSRIKALNRKEKKDRIDTYKEELKHGIKRPLPLNQWIERTEIELKIKSTKYEQIVFNSLTGKDKSKARMQEPFKINGRVYFADIYIPGKKIVIEVDGGYHNTPEQIEKDKIRDADLLQKGVRTIRIPNDAIKDGTLPVYLKQIRRCNKSKNFMY